MYKPSIYKFKEDLPSDSGFTHYDLFKKGTLVILDDDFPWKYCILCDKDGNPLLDEEDKEIYLDWTPYFGKYPVWEGLLELVRKGYCIDNTLVDNPVEVHNEEKVFTILFHDND